MGLIVNLLAGRIKKNVLLRNRVVMDLFSIVCEVGRCCLYLLIDFNLNLRRKQMKVCNEFWGRFDPLFPPPAFVFIHRREGLLILKLSWNRKNIVQIFNIETLAFAVYFDKCFLISYSYLKKLKRRRRT